ncbi:pyridoxal 5'-phosphate synthase glutaminase subunit PdxT [Candidatus Gracilibacteria bacterium]|nr:pyridoxal 5'-phosphate synthase glutaminase subunit PdxT [Candidatus Gracilibacteria bacterium]
MKVGILALQGSFAEHASLLRGMGRDFVLVRSLEDLQDITHLIIPGGESTTMVKLLKSFHMWELLERRMKKEELRILGTCAGAILCSYLGMDIDVDRNGYGAQQESFSAELESKQFPNLRGVFIRAPRFKIKSHPQNNPPSPPLFKGGGIKVLAMYKGEPVMVEQGNFLALAFHPEIAGEKRIHEYFLK